MGLFSYFPLHWLRTFFSQSFSLLFGFSSAIELRRTYFYFGSFQKLGGKLLNNTFFPFGNFFPILLDQYHFLSPTRLTYCCFLSPSDVPLFFFDSGKVPFFFFTPKNSLSGVPPVCVFDRVIYPESFTFVANGCTRASWSSSLCSQTAAVPKPAIRRTVMLPVFCSLRVWTLGDAFFPEQLSPKLPRRLLLPSLPRLTPFSLSVFSHINSPLALFTFSPWPV